MSEERRAERDLVIPPPRDPARRQAMLDDYLEFFRLAFPRVFYQPFTPARKTMLESIIHAARYGGDMAVAAPRGDGKTRAALFATAWLMLRGEVAFPMIVSKSAHRGNLELANLKHAITDSDVMADDFPELLTPIRALCGWASRARMMTVYGRPIGMRWGTDAITWPTIPVELLAEHDPRWNGLRSVAAGQKLASLGIRGPIRGYSIDNARPDVAIIDDVEDRASASSPTQIEVRCRTIDEDIGGLAGPAKTIGRVMLCTLLNRSCVAAIYTDRAQRPSWRGLRHKLIDKFPEREDLWERFVELRQERAEDDPDGRVAHAFYLANREDMDAGAVVTNPYRFDQTILSDGQPREVSALESFYCLVADRGRESVLIEYNNDPPEVGDNLAGSGLFPRTISRQVSGLGQGELPADVFAITQGVDVGKWLLHWVVRAWRKDGTGFVIDYGRQDVHGVKHRSDEGIDRAITRAIARRVDEFKTASYGQGDLPRLTVFDAGYRTEAVYAACAGAGTGVYPVMGFGKSAGCCGPVFTPGRKRTADMIPGDGWNLVRKGRVWLLEIDADRWKRWEHDRWSTATDRPGCLFLWGQPSKPGESPTVEERSHQEYAAHICAESETDEVVRGSLRRRWVSRARENHWLDASCYANAAANVLGVRLAGPVVAATVRTVPRHAAAAAAGSQASPVQAGVSAPARRPSLGELAARARTIGRR